MYKSIITPEHDIYTQKRLDEIKNLCNEIISELKNTGNQEGFTSAQKLKDILPKFNIPNIYARSDNIKELTDFLKKISLYRGSNLAAPGQVQSQERINNAVINIKGKLGAAYTSIEELQYLVDLKSKDVEMINLNESIIKAQESMVGINNEILSIQQSNQKLVESINTELEKAVKAQTLFNMFIQDSTQTTKELIGLTSAEKATSEYETKSNIEKNSADKYRKYSIISLLTASGLILFTLIIYLGSAVLSVFPTDYTWGISFEAMDLPTSVLFLAFLLLIPAAYFARESHKHRTLEILNLKTSQDLKSFLPFVEALPEPEKTMVKTYLAINIFSKDKDKSENEDSPPVFIQDLLLKLAEKKIGG